MVNSLYRGSLSTHTSKTWQMAPEDVPDLSECGESFHDSFSGLDTSEASITNRTRGANLVEISPPRNRMHDMMYVSPKPPQPLRPPNRGGFVRSISSTKNYHQHKISDSLGLNPLSEELDDEETKGKQRNVRFDTDDEGHIKTSIFIMDRGMPNDYRWPMFYTQNEYDDMKIDASYNAEDYLIDHPVDVQEFASIVLKESYMNLPMLALPAWKKQVLENNNNDTIQNVIRKWSSSNGRGLEEMIAPIINETSKKSLREILKEYQKLRTNQNMSLDDISFIISQEYIRCNEGAIRLAYLLALGDEMVANIIYTSGYEYTGDEGQSTLASSFSPTNLSKSVVNAVNVVKAGQFWKKYTFGK